MKFVAALSDADRTALEQVYHAAPAHRQRQRAQAILLSARRYTLDQLADLFQTHRDTVSGWLGDWQERGLGDWQERGLAGLQDAPKSGRPPKLDAAAIEGLHRRLEAPSPDLKAHVLGDLKKKRSP